MESTQHAASGGTGWVAALLRLTAFPCNIEDVDGGANWETLVGEAPATIEQQPRVKTTVSKGPIEAGELVHARHADRMELLYTATAETMALLEPEFPNLGSLDNSLTVFRPFVTKWLDGLPPLKRIAFGAVLWMPMASHRDAYQSLGRFLPGLNLDPDTSDFQYQINRPRDSRHVPGLKINRLSKWGAMKLSGIVHLGTKPVGSIKEAYACRVELDINTHQGREDQLPCDLMHSVFEELVTLCTEIVEKGDIA